AFHTLSSTTLFRSYRSYRAARPILREDLVLVWVFISYFLVAAASKAWQANSVDNLDQPLRAALVVPILLMLLRQPFDLRWMWSGMIIGATTEAGVGASEMYLPSAHRAQGGPNV